ncbi:Ctla2a [Cordylochernes scorpioides]|uniref:Ctla2a n=1 Tax=Cordylochernes scorpioides TaxID=51811 RepID=A0ABY6JXL2_9ARAC|nr:Ctla2a [Cordylochernes scorpioides]
MKTIVLLMLAICGLAFSHHDSHHHWNLFKHKFGKSYSPEEEFHRKAIFNENLEEIIKHNLDYDLGLKSYRLGLNQFSDMVS